MMRRWLTAMVLLSAAAKAQPANALRSWQLLEAAPAGEERVHAEYLLAQSLQKLGLGYGAFFHYSRVIQAGPAQPWFAKALEGAVEVTEQYGDEVLGPNLFDKAQGQLGSLPSETVAKVDYYIALLAYRAGNYEQAGQLLRGVPPESSAYAQAQYLAGLVQQRAGQRGDIDMVGLVHGVVGAGQDALGQREHQRVQRERLRR